MAIKIGEAVSRRRPKSFSVTPDDRQQLVKTINGVVVLDFGRFENGDTRAVTAVFDAANWALVQGYWTNRTKVTFVDEAGNSYTNCRIIVKSISYTERFETKRIEAALEVWRV